MIRIGYVSTLIAILAISLGCSKVPTGMSSINGKLVDVSFLVATNGQQNKVPFVAKQDDPTSRQRLKELLDPHFRAMSNGMSPEVTLQIVEQSQESHPLKSKFGNDESNKKVTVKSTMTTTSGPLRIKKLQDGRLSLQKANRDEYAELVTGANIEQLIEFAVDEFLRQLRESFSMVGTIS